VNGDYGFVAAGEAGLLIMDISNPEDPENVSICITDGYVKEVCISGNYAYIADREGLFIVDLSDIENPEIVGFLELGARWDVSVSGDYAYLTGSTSVKVIDISNPENPCEVCYFRTSDDRRGCVTIVDDYAYVGLSDNSYRVPPGLTVIDISNPCRLAEVRRYFTSNDIFSHAMGISVNSNIACVAMGYAGVIFYDISDLENDEEIGFYRLGGYNYANDVNLIGRLAYTAYDEAGISLIDISNPRIPEEVGYFNTPGKASGIAVDNDLIYLADGTNVGIYRSQIVENSSASEEIYPNTYSLMTAYPNPFNAITNLSYSLPITSPVTIQICDMSGRLIETLVNDLQPAGQHSITWNSLNASSGVYLVRMESAGFRDVRKVFLVR